MPSKISLLYNSSSPSNPSAKGTGRIHELDFVPHPRFDRPEIIKMDYGMTDGSIRMRVRAAVAGYMLLRWSVDCLPDHRLKDEQYRLWLSDPLAL